METAAYDNIISGIYRAAAGLGEWRAPLESITREFGLWASQIIGVDKRSQTLTFSVEGGEPPESALDYLRTYHAINPRLMPSMQLRLGEWMHCHEHFNEQYVANSAFYQDFLIPYGGRYLSGTKIIDDEHHLVMLGAMRGYGAQPLNQEEVQWLTRIRSHVVEAMGTYLHLRTTYAQAGVGKLLLDEFRYPAVLVDQHRAIVYKNQSAAKLLAKSEALVSANNLLRCKGSEDDTNMLEALRSLGLNRPVPPGVTTNPAAGATTSAPARRNRGFVRLAKTVGGRGMALFLTAIWPDEVMQSFGHTSLALLVLHEPSNERKFDPFIIGEIFGLTPAESRVAVCVAQGKSIEKIAQDYGVLQSTIRSQLKSIFAKTGTGRQSEIASLLAGLPDL